MTERDAKNWLQRGRYEILKAAPFFGYGAMKLTFRECSDIKTLSTDGQFIRYNPDYVEQTSTPEIAAYLWSKSMVLHEVMHSILGHCKDWRARGYDPILVNKAQDYVINLMIDKMGFPVHPTWLFDRKYAGMTWQEVYKILKEKAENGESLPESHCVVLIQPPPSEVDGPKKKPKKKKKQQDQKESEKSEDEKDDDGEKDKDESDADADKKEDADEKDEADSDTEDQDDADADEKDDGDDQEDGDSESDGEDEDEDEDEGESDGESGAGESDEESDADDQEEAESDSDEKGESESESDDQDGEDEDGDEDSEGDGDGEESDEDSDSDDQEDGDEDGESPGDGEDSEDEAEESEKKSKWNDWDKIIIEAATWAEAMGKLPSDMREYVREIVKPRHNWKATLYRFMSATKKGDYSFRRPNKRYSHLGIVMPSLHTWTANAILGVDSSGSTYDFLPAFFGHVAEIVRTLRVPLDVAQVDTEIKNVFRLKRPDDVKKLAKETGGGTDFVPFFEWIKKEGKRPEVAIFFTDGWGTYPDTPPPYKVLWCIPEAELLKKKYPQYYPPFGTVIDIPKKDLK